MFVLQLLQSMKIKVKLPIIVHVDNVGAIFMTKNIITTGSSKHVDIRYEFVTEYIDDGIIKVTFVKSADNDSEMMTKYLESEFHSKHAGKMISMTEILWYMKLSVPVLALSETPTYQMKETDHDKKKGVKKYIFWGISLSRSFEIGGSVTKLLNQFDDWWFRKSKEIWVSILQNTTSAKWMMTMEIFWTS